MQPRQSLLICSRNPTFAQSPKGILTTPSMPFHRCLFLKRTTTITQNTLLLPLVHILSFQHARYSTSPLHMYIPRSLLHQPKEARFAWISTSLHYYLQRIRILHPWSIKPFITVNLQYSLIVSYTLTQSLFWSVRSVASLGCKMSGPS